ncbi:hypothetical protein LguiA_029185 [Lonicera macranthoides]
MGYYPYAKSVRPKTQWETSFGVPPTWFDKNTHHFYQAATLLCLPGFGSDYN